MTANTLTPILLLGAAFAFSQAALGYCNEEKTVSLEFSAEDLKEIRLNALAGELELEGSDRDNVTIRGMVCTDRKTYLDRMDIAADIQNGVLELTAIIPYHERDWHADYAYIDLTLEVPSDLNLLVKDSSGDLEAYGVTISELNDNSGDIRLRNTSGNLNIRDSAGFVSVREHRGDIQLEDSAGDLQVDSLTGDLLITRDSSGDINVETITGKVTVDRDSSGDIDIESVGGNVVVGSDGSGSIKIHDVRGSVEIGSDGSGNINVQSIDGDFVLKRKGSGDIRTAKIGGGVNIPEY